jgi:manganese-dependent inorganic pyrophosphatase
VVAGEINKVTKHVLNKFGFNAPELLINAKDKIIILVDHNESTQMVEGGSEAKIMEILDHHKMNFSYGEPIEILVKIIGSSNSIIYQKYQENNIAIEKKLAGIMLSAILDDTVISKSPTCTAKDIEIINELSQLAGIENWKEYGMEMFKVKGSVSDFSVDEIIKMDFKDFDFKAGKFGIGQVETVDLNEFKDREEDLLKKLDQIREEESYHSVILFITDIMEEGSLFLISTINQAGMEEAFDAKIENGRFYKKDLMSRKKQVSPKLAGVFDR